MVVCDICKSTEKLTEIEIGDTPISSLFGLHLPDGESHVICSKCARKLKRYIRYEKAMNERRKNDYT